MQYFKYAKLYLILSDIYLHKQKEKQFPTFSSGIVSAQTNIIHKSYAVGVKMWYVCKQIYIKQMYVHTCYV